MKLPTPRQIVHAFDSIPHEYFLRKNKARKDAKLWEVCVQSIKGPVNPKVLAAFSDPDEAEYYREGVEDDARGKSVLRLFNHKR